MGTVLAWYWIFGVYAGAAMIDLKNVSFHYKSTNALGQERKTRGVDGLTLHISKGEFVVLAGDSGCGKTTVTRLINGLVPHYYDGDLSGEVMVCGIDALASDIGSLSKHVGSVFQNPRSQFFNVDTTSEMAFAAENLCTAPDLIRTSIRHVAGEMKIEYLMDRSILALSGGEKQKIACASVAVTDPEVIVLDEPSSNLDAAGIVELRKVLALWKSQGKTIIIAEHRLYFLADLADRLLFLKDGAIVENLDVQAIQALSEEDLNIKGLRTLSVLQMPEEKQDACAEERDYLICRNFDFHYKNSDNGIHFSELKFQRGEITAIIGENGAGKSTFARVLCGLERKAKGIVLFDGREWTRKNRTDLCYMIMQDVNHQLFTDSVLEEVLLSVPTSVTKEEREPRAKEILDKLDLSDLADTHPMALSGGQKQRVAIASAVVSGDPVLLFDEPTSGLDLRHMKQVAEVLHLLKKEGKTVLVITHDTELVREVADQVVTMKSNSEG